VGRPVCIAIHSLVAAQAGLKPRASKPGFTAGATVDVSLPSCDIFDDLMEFGFAVFFPGHEGEGAQPGTEGGHGLEDGQGLIGEVGWCVWGVDGQGLIGEAGWCVWVCWRVGVWVGTGLCCIAFAIGPLKRYVNSFCCYGLVYIPSGFLVVFEKPNRSSFAFAFTFTFTFTEEQQVYSAIRTRHWHAFATRCVWWWCVYGSARVNFGLLVCLEDRVTVRG
jgi:hypothetical protein